MWILIVIFLALLLYDYYSRRKTQQKLNTIPIVSKIPFIGTFVHLLKFKPETLLKQFADYTECYGKSFYAKIGGQLILVTSDQQIANEILSSSKHINKNHLYKLLQSWLGEGLLIADGQRWHKMRKNIAPTFHYNLLEQFVVTFDQQSAKLVRLLKRYADGEQVVNVYPHLALCALDIIAETAMSVKINAQDSPNSEYVTALKDATGIMVTRFTRPYLFPLPLFKVLAPKLYEINTKAIETMNQFTRNIIDQRRSALEAQKSQGNLSEKDDEVKPKMALLDVLLQTSDNGVSLSDQQICEEVNTFMFAGHDTTTSAASFCLYLLSRHAEVQQKLYDEIKVCYGDDINHPITCNDLNGMSYLNCIVKEALRLYPPIPAIGRLLEEDVVIDKVTIPAKSNVIILLWSMLRNSDIYHDPEMFIPERPNASSFLPFSAGPRNCIGQRFAIFEVKTIVVQMLRHYELLPLGEPLDLTVKLVLLSKNGVQFGIKSRIK